MIAHDAADRDGWVPHALSVAFGVLVAAMLDTVPGWAAPLRAWLTLAAFTFGALAAHAACHGAVRAGQRRWRGAWLAMALAIGLVAAAAVMLRLGHRCSAAPGDDAFDDAPMAPVKAAR